MALISKGKFVADAWRHAAEGEADGAHVIVPSDRATAHSAGVLLPNTAKQADIAPFLNVKLIAVNFPAFTDGRGFSIARLIRRAGFSGELRAFGNVIPDQYAAALACGFDTVEISAERAARQNEADWLAAFNAREDAYQRGYATTGSILEQRRAAR